MPLTTTGYPTVVPTTTTPAPTAPPTTTAAPLPPTPPPKPCTVRGYYYKAANPGEEVQALTWRDCQQLCALSFSCAHFSYWPDGACELLDYSARLVSSDEACDVWTARAQNRGKLCAGDLVTSGPKACEDGAAPPSVAGLDPPRPYSTSSPPPGEAAASGTASPSAAAAAAGEAAASASRGRGAIVAAVLVPLLLVALLVAAWVVAQRLGLLPSFLGGRASGHQPQRAAGDGGRQRGRSASAGRAAAAVGPAAAAGAAGKVAARSGSRDPPKAASGDEGKAKGQVAKKASWAKGSRGRSRSSSAGAV